MNKVELKNSLAPLLRFSESIIKAKELLDDLDVLTEEKAEITVKLGELQKQVAAKEAAIPALDASFKKLKVEYDQKVDEAAKLFDNRVAGLRAELVEKEEQCKEQQNKYAALAAELGKKTENMVAEHAAVAARLIADQNALVHEHQIELEAWETKTAAAKEAYDALKKLIG